MIFSIGLIWLLLKFVSTSLDEVRVAFDSYTPETLKLAARNALNPNLWILDPFCKSLLQAYVRDDPRTENFFKSIFKYTSINDFLPYTSGSWDTLLNGGYLFYKKSLLSF